MKYPGWRGPWIGTAIGGDPGQLPKPWFGAMFAAVSGKLINIIRPKGPLGGFALVAHLGSEIQGAGCDAPANPV
jgi:hypothetical protein